jgi:hypothetical protein
MAAVLDQSQKLNFTRWPIMNQKVHENPVVHGSYAAEVVHVKKYIAGRIDWLDNKLKYVPTGLQTPTADKPFAVYPNPVARGSQLHLTQPGLVEIYTLQGVLVERQAVSENAPDVSTARLAVGCYIVRLSGDAGTKRALLIVQ